MIDDEFFWIFSSCCVLDLFFCMFWISFCVLCSQHYSVASEAVFSTSQRKFSRKKRQKKKREEHKDQQNVHVSLVFFIRVAHPKYGSFFFSPLKILFLFFFEIDARLSVSRFDYTNAKRASKNDSSARLTPAPTKRRTREREKHAHTEREEHGQTQVESAASEKSPA